MRSEQELLDLLRTRKKDEAQIDPTVIKRDWVQKVDDLIGRMIGWLEEPTKQKLLTTEKTGIEVSEEVLGNYSAPALKVRTPGARVVEIEPVARYIVGAEGRVDLTSGPNRKILLLVEDAWVLAAPPPRPGLKLDPLTKESFFAALYELLS